MATINPATGVIQISRRELGVRKFKGFSHQLEGASPEAQWNREFGWAYKGIYPIQKLTFQQLDYLSHNMPAAYASIEFLKARMCSFNYRVKKKSGKHNNLSQKRADKVVKMLQGPNQYGNTFRQIMMMYCDHLLRFDVAAMEKAVGIMGVVEQIGALDTRHIRPNVADNTGALDPIKAYLESSYDDDEKIINTYGPQEIMWGNLNPQPKSFYGFAPLEVLNMIITMSIYSDRHNLKIVHPNSEKGGGIVWLGDVKQEIRKEFEERYDQFRKNDPGRPLFTGSGSEPKYLSFEDAKRIEWEKLQSRLAEITVSCFGLQLRDVGIQSTHGAAGTAQIEDAITLKSAIIPRMLILTDLFNVNVVEPTGGDDLELEYIMKREDTFEIRTRSASMAVGRGMITMNEARDILDLQLDDYDETIGDTPFFVAGNTVVKLEDIIKNGGIKPEAPVAMPGEAVAKPAPGEVVAKPAPGGNFHRTTTAKNERNVGQNWQ